MKWHHSGESVFIYLFIWGGSTDWILVDLSILWQIKKSVYLLLVYYYY